ncbi:MAG: hypothetical protein ACE5SW_11415 [Nitrososphaeraceae archaeon]
MNTTILKNSAVFLVLVIVAGTIFTASPVPSFSQPYYSEQQEYYTEEPYTKDHKKLPFIQNIKCSNIIINGIDNPAATLQGNMPNGMIGENDEIGLKDPESGNYYGDKFNDINRNTVTCTNINNNGAVEPKIGSLTVKKEVFGCDEGSSISMNCQDLDSNSQEWLSCDDPTISNTLFCQALPENLFDIEILDQGNRLVPPITGSQQGTTIPNLEPGTYTVNEIKYQTGINQLLEDPNVELSCINDGFAGGGSLKGSGSSNNDEVLFDFDLCFEYEDEKGNDCSMATIKTNEDKTCIVKNYIKNALFIEF